MTATSKSAGWGLKYGNHFFLRQVSQLTGKPGIPPIGSEPGWDQLTVPLIGREQELTWLKSSLTQHCLVSVVGLGGIGKTRLALHAAHDLEAQFADGIRWVHLANVDSIEAWHAAFANALGFDSVLIASPDLLAEQLCSKNVLLVLDNFEHLLDHVAWLTRLVNQTCIGDTHVRWLVLSREPLNVPQEITLDLQGLSLQPANALSANPSAISPAEELFLHYAGRAKLGYTLTKDEQQHVGQICRMVVGIPLALELAAAWVALLPTAFIAQQLQHNLDWLTTPSGLTHTAQKSMRAALDYFWSLLSASEQRCLRQLAVFRDGFDRETAQEVTEVSTFFLSALVDRAFLMRHANGHYQLHTMLHQYAEAQLNDQPEEASAIRQRYAYAMCKLLERIYGAAGKRAENEVLLRIETEHSNLQQAVQWAINNDHVDLAMQLVQHLSHFWQKRGYFAEGVRLIDATLALSTAMSNAKYIRVVLIRTELRMAMGELVQSMTDIQGLLPHIVDVGIDGHRLRSHALHLLSSAASQRGDYNKAQQDAEASVIAAQAANDAQALARALQGLGRVYETNGVYDSAIAAYQEALSLHQSVHNQSGVAQVLNHIGLTYLAHKEPTAAVRAFSQAHTLHVQLGDHVNAANSLMYLAMTAYVRHDFGQARTQVESALTVFFATNAQESFVTATLLLGSVLLEQNEPAQTQLLAGLKGALQLGTMPRMLSGLCAIARARFKNSKTHAATELIGLVLSHSASNSGHIQEANTLLTQVRRVLPHDELDRRLASGRRRNLHQTVRQIVADADIG